MHTYWVWFSLLPELTLRQKQKLLKAFPNPEDLYALAETDALTMLPEDRRQALLNKDLKETKKVLQQCANKGIDILPISHPAYPSKLRQISDPPIVLYYRGILPDFENVPVISVVGTRKATTYGLNSAGLLSQQITACGGVVASGGASGIDTHALQGALDAGGRPVAVLGCGVDIVYPPTNRRLFSQIVKTGCLISEYAPGVRPKPWQFPARNRIISGIADGVLVVEAPERSGALITARLALEQGRDVFVVPGNIDVLSCSGSNLLLRDGAYVAINGADVVKIYENYYPEAVKTPAVLPENYKAKTQEEDRPQQQPDKKVIDNSPLKPYHFINDGASQLTPDECKLLGCLTKEPKSVDDVIAQMDMPAPVVLGMLTNLTLRGIVLQHSGRRVSAK